MVRQTPATWAVRKWTVALEVATGAVVVPGGVKVGVLGQDRGVAQWNTGVQGVGDGGVSIAERHHRA